MTIPKENLIGQKFGRLLVIKQAEDIIEKNGRHRTAWLCKCDCGNEKVIRDAFLKNGATQSCGCLWLDNRKKRKPKRNKYDLSGEYGIGYTSKGEEFWFDIEDYNKIKDYCWFYCDGYVVANDVNNKRESGNPKIIKLHRLVMGDIPEDMKVDHKNHPYGRENKIDNRKSNLRIVTRRQNKINAHLHKNNTSGVTGVYWNKSKNKWESRIQGENGKSISLGTFINFDDAVKARKEAEIKYYGEYRFDLNNKEE